MVRTCSTLRRGPQNFLRPLRRAELPDLTPPFFDPTSPSPKTLQAGRGAKPKTAERPGLTEEEIEEIREAFNLFDTDGSGASKTRIQRRICVHNACVRTRATTSTLVRAS
jgi:hypothetical protein